MAFDTHSLEAYSLVATAPTPASSGTSLVVTSGQGSLFHTGQNCTVWPIGSQPLTTNSEIVRITNISTDTLTITRIQEGSAARSIIVGDQIANTITPKVLTDIEAQGYLALATFTSTATVASTTLAAFSPAFTITFTVPATCHGVKVTVNCSLAVAALSIGVSLGLYESTTLLNALTYSQAVSADYTYISFVTYVSAPSAGSHTYNVYGATASNTLTLQAGTANNSISTNP